MNMVAEKVVVDGMAFREAAKTFDVSQGSIAVWVKNYKQGTAPVNSKKPQENPSTQFYRLEERVQELTTEISPVYFENQLF